MVHGDHLDNDDSSGYGEDIAFERDSCSSAHERHSVGSVLSAKQEAEREKLAEHETRLVNRSKIFVYLFILFTAAGVGTATYFLLKGEEKLFYEDEFEEFSEKVFETAEAGVIKASQSIAMLADAITSSELHGSIFQSAPNVTLPNFGVQAENAAQIAGAEIVAFCPFVKANEREQFEAYAGRHWWWLREDLVIEAEHHNETNMAVMETRTFPDSIHGLDGEAAGETGTLAPIWQLWPTPPEPEEAPLLFDMMSLEWFPRLYEKMLATRSSVLSPPVDTDSLLKYAHNDGDHGMPDDEDASHDDGEDSNRDKVGQVPSVVFKPHCFLLEPVFSSFEKDAEIVGLNFAVLSWDDLLDDNFEDEAEGMIIDVENTCDDSRYSFEINSDGHIDYIGQDFVPDEQYASVSERVRLFGSSDDGSSDDESSDDRRMLSSEDSDDEEGNLQDETEGGCGYYISTHLSDTFVENWRRNDAVIYTVAVVSIFLFTAVVFACFDCLVKKRNDKVMATAERSTALVESLFPSNVAKRMMDDANKTSENLNAVNSHLESAKTGGIVAKSSAPIADLFPETTIMFGDLAGFTAWSSTRDASQVFVLLETIYSAFDFLADKRGVFKVETVGDCYVAVAGLPKPRADHHIAMARFANDCLMKMSLLLPQLEIELGPDTSDLSLRIGLHSGPVTAGVLRGQKARFQLFGDSVNTAARIESTGVKGRIHCSKATADLLTASGKGSWVTPREGTVFAKGKGELQTYFINIRSDGTSSTRSGSTDPSEGELGDKPSKPIRARNTKEETLILWGTEAMAKLLRSVVSSRRKSGGSVDRSDSLFQLEKGALEKGGKIIDEVRDSICFPNAVVIDPEEAEKVELEPHIREQLESFVRSVADLYGEHDFHNFSHAIHVAMSVMKLLRRMTPIHEGESALFDPLTEFTLVLAALIHDLDHPGIPNSQLLKEKSSLISKYGAKSAAEQLALDTTWKLLMGDEFTALRRTIYTSPQEFQQFRQILVNALMATDIVDKELNAARSKRWDRAFGGDQEMTAVVNDDNANNLKDLQKTVILEHLLQASDVAHLMQHWHVYQEWNQRLLKEMSLAFMEQHGDRNPCEFWYQGELAFFDFYIIPLANKLKACEAFGANSHEYLNYAVNNRHEWEIKGEGIVAEFARFESYA